MPKYSSQEPSFGVNVFDQAKYLNETETIANAMLNILVAKPGFFPSMPDLGMDVPNLLYSFWDEIDTNTLKAKLVSQCSAFKQFVDDGSFDIVKSSYKNQPLLLFVLPVVVKNIKEHLAIGITQDSNGNTSYNYVFLEYEE